MTMPSKVGVGLIVLLGGMTPALAQPYDPYWRQRQAWREREWREHHAYVYRAPPPYYAPRPFYYAPPLTYSAPPPVIYGRPYGY